MAERNDDREPSRLSEEDKERQAISAKMRQQFTAADLQKYTEIEPGIPLENVIAEMEEIHHQVTQSKRKKP